MDFAPVVSEELREMSPEVFNDSSMSSLREAFQMDARA
jgi:acyl CoA:acetate/3-ketoacid CoA transferase